MIVIRVKNITRPPVDIRFFAILLCVGSVHSMHAAIANRIQAIQTNTRGDLVKDERRVIRLTPLLPELRYFRVINDGERPAPSAAV